MIKDNLVLVYGTLMAGHKNHEFMEDSLFIEKIHINLPYKMVSVGGHYPALIDSPIENQIVGEIYRCSDEVLNTIDYLEGAPDYYQRKTIQTISGKTYLYVMPDKFARLLPTIKSGDWGLFQKN